MVFCPHETTQDYIKARRNWHSNQVQAIIPLNSTLLVIEEHSLYISMLKFVVTKGQLGNLKKKDFEEAVSLLKKYTP